MQVGDLIRFNSTGCQCLVTEVKAHGSTEFVSVLCGPDADGDNGGETLAFPRLHIEMVAELVNASR